MLGYAYILTHPGIPCLFWEHHFDWGLADDINKLVGEGVGPVGEGPGGGVEGCVRWGKGSVPAGRPVRMHPTALGRFAPRVQVALRRRAGIRADSRLEILAAEPDMYVARVNGNVTLKLGPRFDMGGLVPRSEDGWQLAASGPDFAVWEKGGA